MSVSTRQIKTSFPLSFELLAHVPSHGVGRRWLGTRSYWLCQLLGWGGLFILLVAPLPLKARVTAAELWCHLSFVLSGLLISHVMRGVILLALSRSRRLGSLTLRTLPWVLLLIVCHVGMQAGFTKHFAPPLNGVYGEGLQETTFLFVFADNLSLSVGIFVVWLGFYFALLTYRSYQAIRIERLQLAATVQEAAWKALQAQLNPHLLFNSLNSIRALIPRDQSAPRDALTHLSELLRSSLTLNQDELIPFAREMETVDSFLALEGLRFEKRLRVRRSIAPGCEAWQVPPFLIQTLMENAVKYGVAPYEEGGDIGLSVHPDGELLQVEVTNRGRIGSPGHAEGSTGVGLSNLRTRLALLFGPAASLVLENSTPDQVCATVRLPKARLRTRPNPQNS